MKFAIIALCLLAVLKPAFASPGEPSDSQTSVHTGTADGTGFINQTSPALTGVRRPLYRLHKSDTIVVHFTFSPELDQTLSVQPDGLITLQGGSPVLAEGRTLNELTDAIRHVYSSTLRDPEVTVFLKEFEKPFFVAGGQVAKPGKYELRSSTGIAQAIALAGGFTDQSKHSQVVLFRKVIDGVVETHVVNLKSMLAARNLDEDIELQSGDMLYVPQNRISKIKKYLPVASLSTFFTPAQF
jgi:polysaccharide biosynthesis/export protein